MAKKTRAAPRCLPHAKRQPGLTTKPQPRVIGKPRGTTKVRQKPKNLDAKGRRIPRKGEHGPEKIQIDIDSCRPLIALGCSNDEIADCLGISRKTLERRLAENSELAEAFVTLKGERKRNLRAWLTRAASRGSARVLLHLAAHELGQTPVRSIELSGPNGGPIEVNREMQPLLERKLAEFIRSKRDAPVELPVAPPPLTIEAEAN